jgi:acyl-CoA reductase-like NAD-dependent aldehyde dehydrogenase
LVEVHGNLIGGERVLARGGGSFDVFAARRLDARGQPRSASSRAPTRIGSFARSGGADVADALEAARASEDAWWSRGSSGRREVLARAARELAGDPDPEARLAARLGLATSELAARLSTLHEGLQRALAQPESCFRDPRIVERGWFLHAPGWGDLVAGTACPLFAALALGRTAILASDPVAPMVADAIAAALGRAELPSGVLAVLHGDTDDALRAALAGEGGGYLLASGSRPRLRRVERLAGMSEDGQIRPGFGAGVRSTSGTVIDLRPHGCRSAVVSSDADLAGSALEVAAAAFGRARSLSGQLPGQVARVIVPERSFSRFTEELLAVLRGSAEYDEPVPFVDREAEEVFHRARVLGLDEGATLIFEGQRAEITAAALEAGAESAAVSREEEDDAILAPSVFTNVEERMRLAALDRPSSILCLLRAGDEARARVLAQRLDGEEAFPGASASGPPPGRSGRSSRI